jgi:hypothetical protein
MKVNLYNAKTDELISTEELTDEVIERIAQLSGETADQVREELILRQMSVWTPDGYYTTSL